MLQFSSNAMVYTNGNLVGVYAALDQSHAYRMVRNEQYEIIPSMILSKVHIVQLLHMYIRNRLADGGNVGQ